MKVTSYVAFALSCFVASSISAPTLVLRDDTGILGSITNPSVGGGNNIIGNSQDNGDRSGSGNAAGDGNGDGNGAGNGNQGGNDNTINLGVKDRGLKEGLTGVLDSITASSAGNGNDVGGNGAGNGNGNGNGNSAGNGNANDNSAGNGNQAGNGNSINVGNITLPHVELPDINIGPSINLA